MFRLILVLAVAGLLVACTGQNAGGGNGSAGAEASTGAASSPDASADASGAAGTSGGATAECTEAFGPVAEMDVTTLSELGDLQAEVEPTVDACESIDDWVAGAGDVIEDDVNPNTARLLLGIFCNDPTLSNSRICEELATSSR